MHYHRYQLDASLAATSMRQSSLSVGSAAALAAAAPAAASAEATASAELRRLQEAVDDDVARSG